MQVHWLNLGIIWGKVTCGTLVIVFIGYLSDFQSLFNMVIIYLTQCGIIHNADAMYWRIIDAEFYSRK
jgi:hypothetical protein